MSHAVLVNGLLPTDRAHALAVDDRGVQYGDGLFETMLARNGRVFRVMEHLERLARDLPLLGGSRAQQDLFLRSLLLMAAQAGGAAALHRLCEIRCAQRVEDRFQASLLRHGPRRHRTVLPAAGLEIREAS